MPARNEEDIDRLPRVTEKNVLILKYYSFENYFLDPKVMAQIGVLGSEEEFYEIFLEKWKEYLQPAAKRSAAAGSNRPWD